MLKKFNGRPVIPGVAVLLLSGALVIPTMAQNATPNADQAAQPAAAQSAQSDPNAASTYATGQPLAGQSKEGFWGHVNPFARKKWVARQVDPIRDRENELDQLQSKNAHDIKDVDSRAQSGIANAMTAANSADQHAAAANDRANSAQNLASNASDRTDTLGNTVNNLDQYKSINSTDVPFAKGRTTLGPKAKEDLDAVATQLNGQKGFIVEVEGFSKSGIAPSQAMADAVVRYLVVEHQVPVYRIFRTAIGKQTETASADSGIAPLTNGVRVTLMQNSLGTLSNGTQPGSQSSNAPTATNSVAQNGQAQ
jgi:outer membrane protein OmpA-like peptidoglycan-associated protein